MFDKVLNAFMINPFVPNALFFYPLGVEKGCIGNEWVNVIKKLRESVLNPFHVIGLFHKTRGLLMFSAGIKRDE